ncbi:hypothetical protein [Desulfobacula sp.]
MKEFIKVTKALSDPTRVKILKVLQKRHHKVGVFLQGQGGGKSFTLVQVKAKFIKKF